jgi:hypothetical protein
VLSDAQISAPLSGFFGFRAGPLLGVYLLAICSIVRLYCFEVLVSVSVISSPFPSLPARLAHPVPSILDRSIASVRMPLVAVSSEDRAKKAPPEVLGGGYHLQVTRITARPVAAQVVEVKPLRWAGSVLEAPCNPMRGGGGAVDGNYPIPASLADLRPHPASLFILDGILLHEFERPQEGLVSVLDVHAPNIQTSTVC